MYAVVGCSECEALWVVADRPETTRRPRCGTRHRFERLKRLATADEQSVAREARAALLAERRGDAAALDALDSMAEMADRLDDAGVDDETYLAESGVDPDAVSAAGERAGSGASSGGSSRRETVREAIRSVEDPTAAAVVAYAAERGVPEDYVHEALDRLVRSGAATRDGGAYRLL
jgi:hypothetical protein